MFLLKGAKGLVFPSLYEGFGLPVLEAMEMGTPVITSKAGALEEVGGKAVCYVDPWSVSSISQGIEKLLCDENFVNDLVKQGLIQSEFFGKDKYLARIEAAYSLL
jgi:glycosyltransferase involved in cell wall biosynthesis